MNTRLVVCTVLAVASGAATAMAVTNFGGPTLPGICVLDRATVLTTSKVGIFATGRFNQLRQSAQADVNAQQEKILADNKALLAQQKTLPPAVFQQKQQVVVKRVADLRGEAARRTQSLEAMRQDAINKISQQAQPVILSVYQSRHCGLLLSREAVLAGNPGLDVTGDVVKGLNAKISVVALAEPKSTNLAGGKH